MRVLHVINGLGPGGAERSFRDLIEGLTDRGIDSEIAIFADHDFSAEGELVRRGVAVHTVAATSFPARCRAVRRLLRRHRPDVVLTALFDSSVVARVAAIGTGVPVLTSIVNTSYGAAGANPHIRPRRLEVVRRIDGWTARHLGHRFHALTSAVKDNAVRTLGIDPDRVRVIPRGRSAERLGERSPERRARVRERLALGADEFVVVNVGRREYQKGQSTLVEAVAVLHERGTTVHAVVAGRDGLESQRLHDLVAAHGLDDAITFLGHTEEVADVVAAADAFAFPSLYEGLGGAMLEAMAIGTPIVASDIPALRELLENGRLGLLVRPDDPSALADAIHDIATDAPAAQARAEAARATFQQHYRLDGDGRDGRVADRLARLGTTAVSAPPVRVLHLLGRLSQGGGVQIVVRRLARHLDPAEIDLHVRTVRPRFDDDHLDEVPATVTGIGYAGSTYGPLVRLRIMVAFATHARRLRPDVVQLHSGTAWYGLLTRLILRRAAFLIEVHDAPGSGRHGRASDALEGFWVRRLGATAVCHSSSVEADIEAQWSPPAGRVVRFPLSVDTERFRPASGPARGAAWRAGHGLASDDLVLIGIGRLVPSKRFELAVDTAAVLAGRGMAVHLVLVGNGPERAGLEERAERAGISDRVHFVGLRFDDDLVDAIVAADLLVSTSAYEGFGLTLVEAMACGLPVVSMAVGGVTDLVDDGVTGWLTPTGDLPAFVDRVTRLAGDADERSSFGEAGRLKAQRCYADEVMARAFTTLYLRLAGRSPAVPEGDR